MQLRNVLITCNASKMIGGYQTALTTISLYLDTGKFTLPRVVMIAKTKGESLESLHEVINLNLDMITGLALTMDRREQFNDDAKDDIATMFKAITSIEASDRGLDYDICEMELQDELTMTPIMVKPVAIPHEFTLMELHVISQIKHNERGSYVAVGYTSGKWVSGAVVVSTDQQTDDINELLNLFRGTYELYLIMTEYVLSDQGRTTFLGSFATNEARRLGFKYGEVIKMFKGE
jgi:hypothetical protein